uniref:SURP and G-patch domain-containing protein 1-like isoform X2 n=1 Tax=Lonchura striata TaxID=40157 RepID=UPI000B4DA54E|nr:SURP and G-patch domain-containing protein 1-like isoform X2 [Lonchura striata domestica]
MRQASRWFGVAQSRAAKASVNILQQEELIAQKKREIEARLEQQARQNSLSIPQLPLLGECVGIPGTNHPGNESRERRPPACRRWEGSRGRKSRFWQSRGRKIPILME